MAVLRGYDACPADNPIVPTDLEPCRKGEQRRRQMLEVAEADLERGFVHPQACRKSLAERVDANDRAFRALHDGGAGPFAIGGATWGATLLNRTWTTGSTVSAFLPPCWTIE
jgi:hypothetical protein